MKHADNPKLTLALESLGYKFYTHNSVEDYHLTRKLEAERHIIYANAGATRELIQAICKEIIERANRDNFRTARTDIAVLANNLLYRTSKPVDEHCAMRMGAIMTFISSDTVEEDINSSGADWLPIKEELAMKDPNVYSFFLITGIALIPEYRRLADTLQIQDYFRSRREDLAGLTLATPKPE